MSLSVSGVLSVWRLSAQLQNRERLSVAGLICAKCITPPVLSLREMDGVINETVGNTLQM